ncbi:MAG: DUF4249 domain-containing protein [Imperialibacter sp.]|uniref:DUF4249 domain-containing protein n=1 Tax=Imperialibacter sp. TaxID=2038411 RepID=UPI0032EDEBBD
MTIFLKAKKTYKLPFGVAFRKSIISISILLPVIVSCTDPFNPSVDTETADLFVVDGFVNASDSTAIVTLSHSRPLTSRGVFIPEKNAQVMIESSEGESFSLQELDSGKYALQNVPVNKTASYTLRVQTISGVTYTSEPVTVINTPPIDSLSYGLSNDKLGLSIRLNTHDDSGNSRYYTWEYSETYEYRSYFNSGFTFENNQPEQRTAEEAVNICYLTVPSTRILLGTSAALAEDVIQGEELTIIPKYSPKISVRYSILIRQRVLSAKEYDYLYQLRQVTERLGTFFDPLPGEVIGNISREGGSSEMILGNFSVAEVYEERFFITKGELPLDLQASPITKGCQLEFTCDIRIPRTTIQPPCVFLEDISDNAMIIEAAYDLMGKPYAYSFALEECGDCRAQGGITTKPNFW